MQTPNILRIRGTVMDVNSYVIETADSIVVVDGMLTVSDARAVRSHIAERGKPLRGLIVTHAHPDHYAGANEILHGRDVPYLATAAVAAAIARDDAIKDRVVGPMMGTEWPIERRFPTAIAAATVTLGDITFTVRDVGPGESPADSIWLLDNRHLFVGDLVYNGMHAYLADGQHAAWIAILDQLAATIDRDAMLYVGHGEPGGRALLAVQKRYIQAFVESVAAHRHRAPDERRAAVVADMQRLLPGDNLRFLMELSVDPLAAQLG
ncbi:MAG: MBL fold metallo-hydrolase [Kofleriaceae bacterium]|nr:MBL fold metallo-hydrolase [Kofleriaceae bacterium]